MKKLDVTYINQNPDYPTGCETISTIMCMRYLGIDVDIRDFIDNYLPKADFVEEGDKVYGPDPNECFVGSPYNPNSFGCYPKVIVKALTAYFTDKKLPFKAVEETGTDTEKLLKDYIDNDIPVLYWTSIDMLPTKVGPTWYITGTDRKYTWTSNEHCLLITGYDDENIITNDPWKGNGVKAYPKDLIIARHHEQFDGAVVILKQD